MVNYKLIAEIEERINTRLAVQRNESENTPAEGFGFPMMYSFAVGMMPLGDKEDEIDSDIMNAVEKRMKLAKNEMTLYDFVIMHIKMLNKEKYRRKNGEINESAFYQDAFIDKSTWSNMRLGNSLPKKEALLRLIFALKLNEEEANELLAKGASSFNEKDKRDLVILALIDLRRYDPADVYNVLDFYDVNNIYPKPVYEETEEDAKDDETARALMEKYKIK